MKVRETEITGWTVFHLTAPLKLALEERGDRNWGKDTASWVEAQELKRSEHKAD
jgi:hypothetical protein